MRVEQSGWEMPLPDQLQSIRKGKAMSDPIKEVIAYFKWCASILSATTADPNARAQIKNHLAWADAIEALQSEAAALRAEGERLRGALNQVDEHFGPFAEITINGQHDPEDVRVINLVRAAIRGEGE
jgi:hypothetical protein